MFCAYFWVGEIAVIVTDEARNAHVLFSVLPRATLNHDAQKQNKIVSPYAK